jgi:predicted phage terminase large subunit-like protein
LSVKVLQELKVDLGTAGYAGQVDQLPAPEGGTIWQKWFIEVPDDMFPDIEKAHEVATDWDLAYTKEDKNAASAFIKSGTIAGHIYLFDFNWQWLEFPELIKWMKDVGGPHYIEAKASGKSARQVLKRNGIVAIEVKVNSDKISRAKDATPIAEAGMVYIKKSMADRLYNDSKQGILFFPNGQYADLADTLSQMLVRRTKRGKIVSSGAPKQETEQENPLDWEWES